MAAISFPPNDMPSTARTLYTSSPWTDPSGNQWLWSAAKERWSPISETVENAVTDNNTNAVSSNAVFDALTLKAPLANPTFTGTVTATAITGTTGTFSGAVACSNGTAALPALTFGEANTGIFRPSANRFGFSASGAEILTGYSSGCYMASGKAFGINTVNWFRIGSGGGIEITTTAAGGTLAPLSVSNLTASGTVTAAGGVLNFASASNPTMSIRAGGTELIRGYSSTFGNQPLMVLANAGLSLGVDSGDSPRIYRVSSGLMGIGTYGSSTPVGSLSLANLTASGAVTAAAAAFTDGGAQSGSGSFIVTTGGTGLNVGTIPTGTWAARVFNQLDQPNQNGMLVMNRWAGPDSTAFQVGSMYNGASQSFFKIDGIGGTTFSGAMTYGGVTLSNSVTGTGSMVLSASPTFTGPVIFDSTTRPTSAGTGTPDVTDLITRADGDARFGAKELTSSLASDHFGVLNSTVLVDSGITLTLPAGTYELSGLLYVTSQAKASLILDSATGVSCALVSHMGAAPGGSTLSYSAQGAISAFSLGNSGSPTLTFRLFGRIVLTETRTLKIQYAQNTANNTITTTAKKESFLTATPR